MRNLHLTLTLIVTLGGLASPLQAADATQLEARLWTIEGSDLGKLEGIVVREIQRNPQSVPYHYLLTNIYLRRFLQMPAQNKLLERALGLARQTIALDTNSELGYLALADIYDAVGRNDKAREVLLIFSYRPRGQKSWRYFLSKAKIFLSTETLDNSLMLLRKALGSKDVLPEIVIPYVIVMVDAKHAGDQQASAAVLEKWRAEIPHQLFDQYLAALHMNAHEYEKAWQIYSDLLSRDPNNRELRRDKAIVAYSYMGKEEEAQQELLALLTEKTASMETALINMHLGIVYLRRDMTTQAHQAFLIALDKYNDHDSLLELIVNAYHGEKKFRQLAAFLEQLNIERPGNAIYYGLLGDVWTEYIGDYHQAAMAYENAIVLDPYNNRLYSALGLARYRLKEFEQALQMFGKARSLDSLDATAFYNEACIYALLSRDAEAISSLQKAIELDATLRQHARDDTDFDKIRTLPAFMDVVN